MRILIAVIVVGGALIAGAFVFFSGLRGADPGPSVPPRAEASALTQRDAGAGAVEVEVTLLLPDTPEAAKFGDATQTVFLVAMNTHSVDLARYDLVNRSELMAGEISVTPVRWVSTSDANHHRSGALIFPKVSRAAGLELRIKAVAGVSVRSFRWEP